MNHRGIWLTAAVLGVIVLLAQIAGAATRDEAASVAATATVSAELTGNGATISSVTREKVATENETSSDSERAEKADTKTDVAVSERAAEPKNNTAASGTRPGWGCGDTKHKHSGPPGRPGATPPPGCTKTP